MERLPEGSSRRISGRWVARYVTIGGEVRFHRADVGQLPSSFTVREAIEGIDRNRCVKLAAFFKQRRGFRNACVSDGAGFGSWPLMVYVGGNSGESRSRDPARALLGRGDCTEDGQIRIPSHTHGRRFAVTWMVTTTESVPSTEDHPYQTKKNHFLTSQKTHPSAKHLPEMGRLLGEFSLLVQIEEKSPEVCVDV